MWPCFAKHLQQAQAFWWAGRWCPQFHPPATCIKKIAQVSYETMSGRPALALLYCPRTKLWVNDSAARSPSLAYS